MSIFPIKKLPPGESFFNKMNQASPAPLVKNKMNQASPMPLFMIKKQYTHQLFNPSSLFNHFNPAMVT